MKVWMPQSMCQSSRCHRNVEVCLSWEWRFCFDGVRWLLFWNSSLVQHNATLEDPLLFRFSMPSADVILLCTEPLTCSWMTGSLTSSRHFQRVLLILYSVQALPLLLIFPGIAGGCFFLCAKTLILLVAFPQTFLCCQESLCIDRALLMGDSYTRETQYHFSVSQY